MADRDRLIELMHKQFTELYKDGDWNFNEMLVGVADYLLANGVILPIRCKDCIHAVELDKHCDISRTAYRHCGLLRGEETKYVWHKYKKYYKDYSIVDLDGFCDAGELKEREGK
jgi:hypothetical protein